MAGQFHPSSMPTRTPRSALDSLPENSGAALTVPSDVAALLAATTSNGAGYLRRILDTEFRRNGTRVPYLLERWLDQLEASQRARRNTDVSIACPTPFPPSETVSVSEYASTAGTSVQAVRARCRRGTLPATRVDGAWRITIEGTTNEV